MKVYAAVFRSSTADRGERLATVTLKSDTIQGAIDEAREKAGPDCREADTLDIYADGLLVETLGVGSEPYRT